MLKKIAIIIGANLLVVGLIFFGPELLMRVGLKGCASDKDCVVYGEIGDCNCGCYHKDNIPSKSKEDCFCAPPPACECVNGECVPGLPKIFK